MEKCDEIGEGCQIRADSTKYLGQWKHNKAMGKEFFTILMEISTKEIVRMISRMVKGLIEIRVDLSNMLESGRKAKKTDLVLRNRYFQFLGAENIKATGNVTRFTDME